MVLLPHFAGCVFFAVAEDNVADFGGKNQKGVILLCGSLRKTGRKLRGGAAFFLALLLCGSVQVGAGNLMAGDNGTDTARMLIPVGHTVGIKLFSRGVVVVKLPESSTPAKMCGLQTGDVILRCGETSITSTEQFQSLLQKNGGTVTDLQIRRDGDELSLCVEPEPNEQGVYCIGAWIRDSMAGIGTMTYYDPATGQFGALGHGITDVDTAVLMPFSNGSILPSTVKAVKPGEAGAAGELKGNFDLTRDLGALYANTNSGVFGTLEQVPTALEKEEALPVGSAQEGTAMIRANVQGDAVQEYEIKILKVVKNAEDSRDMVICVKDPELIAVTGGIVQGMSGSPIIQNGRIVGAVTHVLVNDPTKGYGISIETMLNAAE